MNRNLKLVVLVVSCYVAHSAVLRAEPQNVDRKPQQSCLNITIDPRVELLAVVALLSGYGERFGLITRHDFPYKQDVAEHFAPYKDHAAVKLFEEMSADNFSFDAPPAAMLYLSEPPELTLRLPFTDYLKQRAGGEKRLNQFVSLLRDFAKDTKFAAFFKTHERTFQQITGDVKDNTEDIDYIETLEDYYGMKQNSFNIMLAPLFCGGFGPRVKRADGSYYIFNICGPMGVKNGLPVFGSAESIRHTAWHEFGHSFVNPTTEKFLRDINKYSSLYEPISDRMKQQAYPNWQICVNEHVVRAVTTRLAHRELGKNAGDRALQDEKGRGFVYVEPLCRKLEQYEEQRDKYPTLVDFYPELVSAFKELSERGPGNEFYAKLAPPSTGSINAIVGDKKSAVVIMPTNEKDEAVQERIHAYVKQIHQRFFKGCPILTDAQALKQNLSHNSIVVYGTPAGNLWIAEHFEELPVRIKTDRIEAGAVFSGDNLRFITAWPNPHNSKKGVVIYTAQQAEDIIGINSVFHGPTDYVVARGTDVLTSSNYDKKNGAWSLSSVSTKTKDN